MPTYTKAMILVIYIKNCQNYHFFPDTYITLYLPKYTIQKIP